MMKLPVVYLRGLVIFPKMTLHFDAGREKTVAALEEAMNRQQIVFLTTQIDMLETEPNLQGIYEIGTVSKIKQMVKLPGGSLRILVEGVGRGKVLGINNFENFDEIEIQECEEKEEDNLHAEALYRSLMELFEEYLKFNRKISQQVVNNIMAVENSGELADMIASNIYLKKNQKQDILNAVNIEERVRKLSEILVKEIDILKIEADIDEKVRKNLDKTQREYHLKEQLKVIRTELGYEEKDDIEEYRQNIEKSDMPAEVKEKAIKELNRLSKMALQAPESGVTRNYLEMLLELPWNRETEDNFDLNNVKKVLDVEHYGLKKIKERVIEFLAVKKLKNNMSGPILCFVGPPGVGKTSIVKSIADALGRKFVRMSLGGVRDESEVRGHRKTYVGAMPGRIISSINKSKSNNPVFLLDEIDKMSTDTRGDAVSAMLELLDYEQNKSFRDNFLEVPFDISNVMFIATANSLDTIPSPLRDRMEIIHLTSYIIEEKYNIAVNHLIPKQLDNHGIINKNVYFNKEAIYDMIEKYTREAGVRNLQREIASVCRKVAVIFANSDRKQVNITKNNLEKFLGKPKYENDNAIEKAQVGVAKGLAWTQFGGDTLDVEVAVLEGTGKIELTGHLGDVMKESARTALSYIRTKAKELEIDEDFHNKYDIHLHVPEGAVPKDGPSAGITIATAIISALKNVPVRSDVAMTGEVTLRGRVLPIGGIKEKVMAAYRIGIKNIICPIANEKDLDEIPKSIREKVKFILVSNVDEVINSALMKIEEFYEGTNICV